MPNNEDTLERNKDVVRRFNLEVIEKGNEAVFREIMAPDFRNWTAPPGTSSGADAMLHTFNQILRPAMPDMSVEIHDQIAEGEKVTTRKTIRGTHLGGLMGIPATHRPIAIEVIDIVTVRNGRYSEHWGINTLASAMAQLRELARSPVTVTDAE